VRLRELWKSFAGTTALAGAEFELAAGEIHALVGANGAGKSTCSRILSGHIRPDRGEILLDGAPARFASARDAIRSGIAIVMQETSLVPDLSVFENIFLPELGLPGRFRRRDFERRAVALLTELGAANAIPLGEPVRALTIAQRQLIEIAKALALDSRVIIDEPTASLSPHEADRLFDVMRGLAQRRKGIIFVSHRLEELFTIADRITVLREGKTVALAVPARDMTPAELIRTMVGYELSDIYARAQHIEAHPHSSADSAATADPALSSIGPPVLVVSHLAAPPQVRDISFTVRAGEIVGLAGLVGAGRSETAQLIFGLRPIHAGTIALEGRPFRARSPADAIAAGLGFVPEDRRGQALIPDFSVRENVLLAALGAARGPGLPYAQRADEVRKLLRGLGFPDERILGAKILGLSGGMQQKVVLARWLLLGPKLLILDEPTRGVDIGTRSSIYALLREVAARGVGVLLISSDFEEVLGLSDRVVVIADGADVTNIPAAFLDVEKLAMFAAPRTSAQGTHRALITLAERFGGVAFWVYVEGPRAYCFDRAGTAPGAEIGFGRGAFPRLDQTAIPRALAQRRAYAFVDEGGCATLIVPLVGHHGHAQGSIGLTLPAASARPDCTLVGEIIRTAIGDDALAAAG
jgi:ribose transport system ATP-binding protein/rhamnose transport system ATP-binding protein